MAAIDQAFPPAFQSVADTLGVDTRKPAELTHWDREKSGLHLVGGFFHFVGSILSGADAWKVIDDGTKTLHLEPFVAGFEIGFTAHVSLLPSPFAAQPATQLEFQTRVGWVIPEAESA